MLNREMGKYEYVGLGNILFGLGYLYTQLKAIFVGIPALVGSFDSLGGETVPSPILYIVALVFTVVGIANLLIGIKLFQKNRSEALLNKGLVLLCISIAGLGVFAIIGFFAVILPVYNLTESI